MNEPWLLLIERHVTLGGILALLAIFLRNHKLFIKAKERLNDLWWDRCAVRQEPYTPVENGAQAVVPPRPFNGD